jgi:hypothetical protein
MAAIITTSNFYTPAKRKAEPLLKKHADGKTEKYEFPQQRSKGEDDAAANAVGLPAMPDTEVDMLTPGERKQRAPRREGNPQVRGPGVRNRSTATLFGGGRKAGGPRVLGHAPTCLCRICKPLPEKPVEIPVTDTTNQ